MRQIILTAAALIAFATSAQAVVRIPAPATTSIELAGGLGHGARAPWPRRMAVAQIAPAEAR